MVGEDAGDGDAAAVLTHAVGKSDPRATVLTQSEMCDRLHRIRRRLMTAQGEAASPPASVE